MKMSSIWTYKLHSLVNRKLMKQRAEKFQTTHLVPKDFVATSGELLAEPSFEALQKRFIVNRDEPFSRRSVLTVLLALIMGLELLGPLYSEKHMYALKEFCEAIKDIIALSKQANADSLGKIFDILLQNIWRKPTALKSIIEDIKYRGLSVYSKESSGKASSLLKAGSCIEGTCV